MLKSSSTTQLPLIGRWTDGSFTGGETVLLNKVSRYGARGVLLNEQGLVAMLHMDKDQRHKLPGGGLEAGEAVEEAFLREVREETGWEADIVRALGYCEEHKNRNEYMQYSYCYLAKALRNHHDISLTVQESQLGMSVRWMTIEHAIDAMDDSLASCDEYSARFMLARDRAILQFANPFIG